MKNFSISTTILCVSFCLTGCGAGSSAGAPDSGVRADSTPVLPDDTEPLDAVVTFSWIPPTQNSDGSNLDDLSGYRIYYGYDSNEVQNQLCTEDIGANLASYIPDTISDGCDSLDTGTTYYFGMTSVNSAGLESIMSNIVRKEL